MFFILNHSSFFTNNFDDVNRSAYSYFISSLVSEEYLKNMNDKDTPYYHGVSLIYYKVASIALYKKVVKRSVETIIKVQTFFAVILPF